MTNNIIGKQAWQWLLIAALLSVLSFPIKAAIPDDLDNPESTSAGFTARRIYANT